MMRTYAWQPFSIPCLLVLVFAFCFWSQASLRGDLVAHWKLDEGEGDVFKDLADGHFDGFLENDTVRIKWIKVTADEGDIHPDQDFAVEFLGNNSGIHTHFSGIGGSAARTVAFWMRSNNKMDDRIEDDHGIVGWGDARVAGGKWTIRLNANELDGPLGTIRTATKDGYTVGITRIDDGRWHHVASVFPEGATRIFEVVHYVDGERDARGGGSGLLINTSVGGSAAPVTIGTTYTWSAFHGAVYQQFFTGAVADVQIFDHALDHAEIQEIFRGPHVPLAFVRGDPNEDNRTDISDAVFILQYLFTGSETPSCLKAADTDDTGEIDLTDAVYLLRFLFVGGPAPELPFPTCGPDPTDDELMCKTFVGCDEEQ